MSSEPAEASDSDSRPSFWWQLSPRIAAGVALAVVLVVAGLVLVVRSVTAKPGRPHAQPVPAQIFDLTPQQAQALRVPAALSTPQPGSVQHTCAPLPDDMPQVVISSLCIDAVMVPTHVVDDSLVIPDDVQQVGRDTDSAALDAANGTTIVAGHVDNIRQGDGVFYFLHQVRPGAEIIVRNGTGTNAVTRWRVYKTAVVDKTALPADIWATTGPRRLILVTCGGALLSTSTGNAYQDNVLVYATPETTSLPRLIHSG
jgi:hypothetical protein